MSWFGKVFPTEFGSIDVWGALLNALFGTAVDTDTFMQIPVPISNPEEKTYTLLINSRFPFTVEDVTYVTGAGTCSIAVQINNSNVGGLGALAATTTETTTSSTTDKTVAAGDDLKIILSSISGVEALTINIWANRTGAGTA